MLPILKSVLAYIQRLDTKFCFSFIGVVMAVFSFWYFIYIGTVNLSYEIRNRGNVLDVHENVGRLDITYAGNSIKESVEALDNLPYEYSTMDRCLYDKRTTTWTFL